MESPFRFGLIGAGLVGMFVLASPAYADDVIIYRCVNAGGKVTLQDRPCPKDVHQEVRQMLRPQDPPPRPEPIASMPPPVSPTFEVRVYRTPRPLYECTTQDGAAYLSQNGIPQARYVPLWTTGIGMVEVGDGRMRAQPSPGSGQFRRGGLVRSGPIAFGPSVYVEDSCRRLPQDEVCERMHARDDTLEKLIFNAQPSDRVGYEREQKGLRTQVRNDCNANEL